ncbi:hypothetical protein ONA92_02220 [Mycobacteroides salmoniphilum]|uniref:hypothetical protein n=1 Tax=Mycobacteroides salmoniphilum TaxID=404941 RepID=UPI0035678459
MTLQTIRKPASILLNIACMLREETDMAERLCLLNARDLLLRAKGIEPQITILGEAS